jgi:uncharacterized protein (DUF58 family)
VQLQPTTWALTGIAGVLFVLAEVLDERILLLAASPVIAFVALRALTFFFQVRTLAGSIEITRKPEHQILRQGGITPVTLHVRSPVPPGMSVSFRDITPPGTRISRGKGEATLAAPSPDGFLTYYDLQVYSRGDLAFGGIQVQVADRYFKDRMHLGGKSFRSPLLHVQPAAAFAGVVSHGKYGSLEVPRVQAIPGQGIRSFRPFHSGDDTHAIDWKLSAKHSTLILREYMGKIGESPLFLLDLPPAIGDNAPPWDLLVAALTTHIEQVLHEFSRSDVVVLSGGRVVRTLTLHRDPRPWYRLMATLSPGEGYLPLFRHPFPLILSSLHRTAEKSAAAGGEDSPFFSRLAAVTGSFRAEASPTVFEKQLMITFSGNREREVFIFSLLQGDQSHIREAIHRARESKMSVHLRIPAPCTTPARTRALLQTGASTVEVLR